MINLPELRLSGNPVSHGPRNDRLPEGIKGLKLAAFGGHRRIDRRTTRIQRRCDSLLLGQLRVSDVSLPYRVLAYVLLPAATTFSDQLRPQ